VATKLQISRTEFDTTYLEKGSHGTMLVNHIPCHFLMENKCTIYEDRFAGCREFPALHLPHFTNRLFTVFMHYSRCPIIFNVIEQLKKELNFSDPIQSAL
jgi:Fe-S-cluster containining protein